MFLLEYQQIDSLIRIKLFIHCMILLIRVIFINVDIACVFILAVLDVLKRLQIKLVNDVN